jgi:hypothetical protein
MKPEVKAYLLTEYGAWSVLIISYLIGLGVSHAWSWTAIPLFLALALLVNSKQSLMKWLRTATDQKPLIIYLVQILLAATILVAVFRGEITRLLPLLIVPVAYLLANKLIGEHSLITELLGFSLLSMAAVLAKLLLTGDLDARLFLGVALYFTTGVFKVKAVLLKKTRDRVFSVLYTVFALLIYWRIPLPIIILLPLLDNLIVAIAPYKVKLKTTGWIEVAKSLLFLGLFIAYY